MRYSKQRELIIDFLKKDLSHPTADTVCAEVSRLCPGISLGTVYRNLNQLAAEEVILKIPSCGGDRFDYNRRKHYHFRCICCGNVSDIPDSMTESIRSLARALNADNIIAEHVCPLCISKDAGTVQLQ